MAALMSSYYWGYCLSQMPAKFLAEKWGAKNVVGYSTLMTSIMTALSPLAYKITFSTMVAARFLIGFFGVTNFAIDMGMVDYYSL